ncbi:hypothetical protein C7416_104474 [Cupriavidus phytorum]|uniref:Uncharacterized protein n=1 Tax=Cupriavidus phytorum TaxID=3024399 RepID=A0A2W7PLM2_9BURK|nr:hypothetical protein [Cupriavidus alkaliphilus]PZX29469.1 hypothetical protein C7416_104474 [Cupriavidus alkaliphilus]
MTAAIDIIKLALADAQVIAEGETPNAATTDTALKTLNGMMALWQLDGFDGFTFPAYAAASADLQLPAEFEMPMRYNLAVHLAAAFASPLRPDIGSLAATTLKKLKRFYLTIPELKMPCAVLPRRYYWNVEACEWLACP